MIQPVFWETQMSFPLNRMRNDDLGGYILSFFFFFLSLSMISFSLLVHLPELVYCRMSCVQLSAQGRGWEVSTEGWSHSWAVASYYNYTDTSNPHQRAAREDSFTSVSLGCLPSAVGIMDTKV